MSRSVEISFDQMDEFLTIQGFKPMDMPGVYEHVYGKRVDKDNVKMSLRVFTSISTNTEKSRKKGEDSIKVELVRLRGKRVQRVKILRNHRTTNWFTHLQTNITELANYEPVSCDAEDCDGLMILRNGKRGEFYGCCNFPGCKNTKNKES